MAAFKTLQVLIPVYNDWASASGLISQIAALKLKDGLRLKVLLVDDGSTEPMPQGNFKKTSGSAISEFSVLRLARNLGHQSAIAVGLGQLEHSGARFDAVVIMDGDGEDAPSDIPRLVEAWKAGKGRSAVFAHRSRRSEGLAFKAFYALYRLAYRMLTGNPISMGNFSLLPAPFVSELLLYQELWRHYPATVKKSRLPVQLVPTSRAARIEGRSKMNFYNLILHGLGAITVHSDIVGVRSLVAVFSLVVSCFLGVGALVYLRYFTAIAVPSWSSAAALVLSVIALQFLSSAIIFSFLTLAGRSPIALNPARNYQGFVKKSSRLY